MHKSMAVVIALTVMASACHKSEAMSTPVMPSGPPPGPLPVLVTLTGTVTDATSGMPMAGVSVGLLDSVGLVTTDPDGHYQMSDLPKRLHHWVFAGIAGYLQPCAAEFVLQGDTIVNLQLVPVAFLSASSAPGFTGPPGRRNATGVVYRTGASGREPVPGASVSVAAGTGTVDQWPASETVSDVTGRYALCGLPVGEPISLFAAVQGPGNYGHVIIAAGTGDAVADIRIGP